MRVVFPFVGDAVGGSHVSSALLIRELSAFGVEPFVFCHRHGPLESYLNGQGIRCSVVDLPYLEDGVGGFQALARICSIVPRLSSFLKSENATILHANDSRMTHTWMPAGLARGIATVAHRRNPWPGSRLSSVLYSLADKIVPVSEFVRKTLPRHLQRKSSVVYNPFSTPSFDRRLARASLSQILRSNGPLIVTVGSLLQRKRASVFIEAAARLSVKYSEARFAIVGRSTPLYEHLHEQVVRSGLASKVVFTGYSSDAPKLLAGADLLVAPAIDEGFGRTLVEAMLSRVPVVASASGAHAEIVKEGVTGLLVPPEDSAKFSGAMDQIISDPREAAKMADRAYAWASERFSPREHARALTSIYYDVARKEPNHLILD